MGTQKERSKRHYELHKDDYKRRAKEWNAQNRKKRKSIKHNSRIRRTFSISPEQYNQLLVAQQGHCGNPNCVSTEKDQKFFWHLDHCHDTGAIRGFLCHGCNVALGLLKEDKNRILGLLQYLANPPANNLLGG